MNRTWIVVVLACLFTNVNFSFAEAQASANELLRLEGRYIDLTTDLESEEEARSLVASLDAAVPQWLSFWKLPDDPVANWKINAFVMRDKSVFEAQGLIPARVPEFPFGYALGDSVFVLAQPSQYYTRHLLLHEGAHSFAFECFGGAGPTWFMEGTAELLATHRGDAASIKINQIPLDRDDVPYWGRFKRMSQVRTVSGLPSIETVMSYPPTLSGDVEAYSWSWAAASMFAAYPEYQGPFLLAAKSGQDTSPDFNRQLYSRLSKQWPALAARWRLLSGDFDFGFNWEYECVDIATDDPFWDGRPIKISVGADRGWQSAGVRLPPGINLGVSASGEVILANDPKPWISRPNGITIEYHNGRPLGKLLARVLPVLTPRQGQLAPIATESVGEQAMISIPQHSWLLFRVNDSVGDLDNNEGAYEVVIKK